MKITPFAILGLTVITLLTSCSTEEPAPDPQTPGNTTGNQNQSGNPGGNNGGTTTPARPAFLPAGFNESPGDLLTKVTLEVITSGVTTRTVNTYTYDQYNRFTEIKSQTEGVSGEAVTKYTYKDAEKKIEFVHTGFEASQGFSGEALLNDDYTIRQVKVVKPQETITYSYTYTSDGKIASQTYDSNLKSYELVYTYNDKGIIKTERKNYTAKSSAVPDREDMILEWTYGDVSSKEYNTLVLSEPNFPSGYLGKVFTSLPVSSKSNITARVSTPIVFEYQSLGTTNYKYTSDAGKISRIESESNTTTLGVAVNVQTRINLEYKKP